MSLLIVQAHARDHGNADGNSPTNVTAFLPKDKDVGFDPSSRPEILFQVQARGQQHHQEPTSYMMYDGQVVLDCWKYGVRFFPEQLPLTLSSELDGQSLEYYMRQNGAITLYDIIGK